MTSQLKELLNLNKQDSTVAYMCLCPQHVLEGAMGFSAITCAAVRMEDCVTQLMDPVGVDRAGLDRTVTQVQEETC